MAAVTPESIEPGGPRWRVTFSQRQAIWGYLLVLPALILLIGLVAYPFVFAIYISFTDRIVGATGSWIGLDNYRYLSKTASFEKTVRNTITIVIVSDIIKLIVGLGLALILNEKIREEVRPGRWSFCRGQCQGSWHF